MGCSGSPSKPLAQEPGEIGEHLIRRSRHIVQDCAGGRWSLMLLSAQLKSFGGKQTQTADSTSDQGREAVRQHELLFGLSQHCVYAGLIFCQAGTLGRVCLYRSRGARRMALSFALFSPESRCLHQPRHRWRCSAHADTTKVWPVR
jgi:hypothetical protein